MQLINSALISQSLNTFKGVFVKSRALFDLNLYAVPLVVVIIPLGLCQLPLQRANHLGWLHRKELKFVHKARLKERFSS
jgi:hypothetical protein